MNDFDFLSPTKIIFGRGRENETGNEVKKYSGNILIVCSRGKTNATGVVDRVIGSVKAVGIKYKELSGIKPNPVLSKVCEGIDIVRQNGIDFILAVGGGSVIDTAKAIALGALYEGDVWDFYLGRAIDRALPVGTVLTIPAAGSELSNNTVITKEDENLKRAAGSSLLYPVFAICNPELTLALSKWQTFCGIADMMMHVMERYFTVTKNTDLTDRLCEAVLKCEINNALILLEEPSNYEARAEIMLASSLSHNNLLGMGREQEWIAHGIAVTIGGLYDSTHGAALTALFSSWARYVMDNRLDKFIQFAMRVFDVEYDFENPKRTALEGIRRLEELYRRMGLPINLKELGIPAGDKELEQIAGVFALMKRTGNIKKIYREDALKILHMAKG